VWRRRKGALSVRQLQRSEGRERQRSLRRRLRQYIAGRALSAERLWPIRHVRQCLAMDGGLLARKLQRSADRRFTLDDWMSAKSPRCPRRLLVLQCEGPPRRRSQLARR